MRTFFKALFWIWNAIMLFWLFGYVNDVNKLMEGMTSVEKSGGEVGAGIGIMMILLVWMIGAVILALLTKMCKKQETTITAPEINQGPSVAHSPFPPDANRPPAVTGPGTIQSRAPPPLSSASAKSGNQGFDLGWWPRIALIGLLIYGANRMAHINDPQTFGTTQYTSSQTTAATATQNLAQTSPSAANKSLTITAAVFDARYEENEPAAQEEFDKFNQIVISGKIEDISLMFGDSVVTLSTPNYLGVHLYMEDSAAAAVKKLKKGQKITATCTKAKKTISAGAFGCTI